MSTKDIFIAAAVFTVIAGLLFEFNLDCIGFAFTALALVGFLAGPIIAEMDNHKDKP